MNPQSQTDARSYTLNCQMDHELAALERLCQVVRIRGFRIARMAVETSDNKMDIALTIQGSRPISMLQTQLEKLQTVARVELKQPVLAAAVAGQTA